MLEWLVAVHYQLKHRSPLIDRRMLGLDIMALAHIRFATYVDHAAGAFEAVIAQLPEVPSCHKITGDADYVVQVLAEDLDSYCDFIEQGLRRQTGSAFMQSSLALPEVKTSSRRDTQIDQGVSCRRSKGSSGLTRASLASCLGQESPWPYLMQAPVACRITLESVRR